MTDRDKLKADLEDTDIDLESNDGDPLDFWEKKQRELVTSVVDYNLSTISDLIDSGSINVDPKYQRRFRWGQDRQAKLIESFLINVPVPPVFLNEDEYGTYSVIDGKQRLLAIHSFLRGRLFLKNLEIFQDLNGLSFDSLPLKFKTVIKMRPTIRAIIILRQSDPDIKFEVFQRLNTGGVHLNAQEIRNSTYPGPLNDAILSLSENKAFHDLLGIKNKSRSTIHMEMRDAEFVLRFFTFHDNWKQFSGGMRRSMDFFMHTEQNASASRVDQLTSLFLNAVNCVNAYFGEFAFRRFEPTKGKYRNQVLASLYDAQMFASQGRNARISASHRASIRSKYKMLFSNSEFLKHIGSGTNSPGFFTERIKAVNSILNSVLGDS